MTLEDLFKQLSYGELSNLANAVDGTGTIKKEQQNRIVAFANEALNRLHLRLPLIETRETLALSSSADLDKTLEQDVLLVTSLLTPYGESLTINTRKSPNTIYVVDGVLHVPKAIGGLVTELQATYRKRHPELYPLFDVYPDQATVKLVNAGSGTHRLTLNVAGITIVGSGSDIEEASILAANAINDDPILPNLVQAEGGEIQTGIFGVQLTALSGEIVALAVVSTNACTATLSTPNIRKKMTVSQEISLLPELHEALTAYIAQKTYGGVNTQDALITAQGYRARYEQVINEVLGQGLLAAEIEQMQKLEARGFV